MSISSSNGGGGRGRHEADVPGTVASIPLSDVDVEMPGIDGPTLLRLLLCSMLGLPLDHYRAVFPRLENIARTVVRPSTDGPGALLMLNAT